MKAILKSKKSFALIMAVIMMVVLSCGLFASCNDNPQGKTVTVSFDLNYPDATGVPSAKEAEVGKKYGFLSTPRRTGYKFIGWYLNSNGTGTAVTKDTIVEKDTDHKLYAKWEVVQSVTVTFLEGDEVRHTAVVEIGKMYGVNGLPLNNPFDKTVEGVLYQFRYWYYEDENGEHVIVDTQTIVTLTEDHNVYAYFAPFKTNYDFSDPGDKNYFRLGTYYGILNDSTGGSYSNAVFDEDKNAIKVTPVQSDVKLLYCIFQLDCDEFYGFEFSIEVVCDAEDNNKSVYVKTTAKGGGPEQTLPSSAVNLTVTNGGTYTVSGVTRRSGDNEVLLIFDLVNIAKRSQFEIYVTNVAVDPHAQSLTYDFSYPDFDDFMLLGAQWAEATTGDADVTLCTYDEAKKAFKFVPSINAVTVMYAHVDWFDEVIWLTGNKSITFEVEVDVGTATGANFTLAIQTKDTTMTPTDVRTLNTPEVKSFENGTYTVTADLPENVNATRIILLIGISDIQNSTQAAFYIKKLTIENLAGIETEE